MPVVGCGCVVATPCVDVDFQGKIHAKQEAKPRKETALLDAINAVVCHASCSGCRVAMRPLDEGGEEEDEGGKVRV